MDQIGLVLEGGGMRGVYTAGVLEFFMEKDIYFPYVIGVSAGACNGASYISKQKGRNRTVNIDYIKDPRYISYRNLIKERSLFGMNFIFDEIPNKLVPFDFEAFHNSEQKFLIGATDCMTGDILYFEKSEYKDILKIIRASSSLPFVSPIVEHNGKYLLDGGITAPIPIQKSINDGNNRNVIVLTRNKGYRKEPFNMKWLLKKMYGKYEGLINSMYNRHNTYNQTLDLIENLEFENKAVVIRPSQPIKVDRIEKDTDKLNELYNLGYRDAEKCFEKIELWSSECNK